MIDLLNYGFAPAELSDETAGLPARITAVHKERYELICKYGQIYGKLKASTYYADSSEEFPTTGDFVRINYNQSGDSQILKTLTRRSFFSRRDPTPGRGEQAVASNFDFVFILMSLNFDFNVKRVERYLTLAWQSGAAPVIVLTKADLVEDFTEQIRRIEEVAIGVQLYVVSAKTGFGIAELKELLKPSETIVLLGSSGAGKSSLVNALAGEDIMSVGDIREDDSKGRHTTTHRQLIKLNCGAMIIDTPGMRELGMWDVSTGLGEAFTDIEQYFGMCRFSDCKHQNEPGCAVKAAIADGLLPQERWDSYLKLKQEAKFTDDKSAYLRQRQKIHKALSKQSRHNKKNGGFIK